MVNDDWRRDEVPRCDAHHVVAAKKDSFRFCVLLVKNGVYLFTPLYHALPRRHVATGWGEWLTGMRSGPCQ